MLQKHNSSQHPHWIKLLARPLCGNRVRDFCCINIGGLCRGFSWRIFWALFPTKLRINNTREERSMDQCRSRPKLSENFERNWSIQISGEIHMDQLLVHTFSWGNSYGPMVLKVLQKFPPTLALVHGWLFPEHNNTIREKIRRLDGQNRQSPVASDFGSRPSNRSPFRNFAVLECLKRIANRAFRIAVSNRRDASDSNRAFLNR